MAFHIGRLSVLSYANGHTTWHYKLPEDELAVAAHGSGYFDAAADMVATGDLMEMTGPDGGAIRVVSKSDGRVALQRLT